MTIQETVTKEFKRRKMFKKEFVRLCKIEAEKRGIAFDDSVIYRFLKGHNSTSVEKLEIMCEVLGLQLFRNDLLSEIHNRIDAKNTEILCSPIRFNGVAINNIDKIFQEYGVNTQRF